MPFRSKDIFESQCNKLTNSTILNNPILTSLLILLCILMVSLWVYRDVDPGEDNTNFMLSLRLSGYLIILIMPIVFLHNRCVQKDYETKGASELTAEIFRKPVIGEDVNGAGMIEIQPDLSGDNIAPIV